MAPLGNLVTIVVPFYNEEEAVGAFYGALCAVLDGIADKSFEVICVDDGSSDDTLQKLLALVDRDARFRVIELSRNFGKEAAITAGLDAARGDAVIPLDADLQDPPELIPSLIAAWQEGAEMVLARRRVRSTDSFLKRKPPRCSTDCIIVSRACRSRGRWATSASWTARSSRRSSSCRSGSAS